MYHKLVHTPYLSHNKLKYTSISGMKAIYRKAPIHQTLKPKLLTNAEIFRNQPLLTLISSKSYNIKPSHLIQS